MSVAITASVARLASTLMLAMLVVSGCGDAKGTSVNRVSFSGLEGGTTSVADFEGRPLVLNMWATNCAPCVKEMPALDEVATEMAGTLVIIGVNVFDSPADAAAFATGLGVGYPQYSDPDGALSTALAVTGLPATAFFDASGTLVDVHQGAYTAEQLRRAIAHHFPAGSAGGAP
jgi:thiol-disulfide isomerase/thioredoxin